MLASARARSIASPSSRATRVKPGNGGPSRGRRHRSWPTKPRSGRARACPHGARGPAATATCQLLSASTVRVCGRRGRCGGVSLLNHDTPFANRNLEPADQRATEAGSHPGGSEQQANSSGCDRVAGGDHPTRWLPPSTRWPGCRAVDDRNLMDPDGCWLDHLLLLAMLR